MLEGRVGGVRCRVSLLFPALLAVLLLRQADSPALCCVLASVIHEGGHLLAMVAAGCPPTCCTLGAFGVRLDMGGARLPGYWRQIAIFLAGPVTNLICAGVLFCFGRITAAAVHLSLAALNLLPAAALDGGQALRCLICLLGYHRQAQRVLILLSAIVLFPLAMVAFWVFFRHPENPTLLIVSGYLVVLIFFSPNF